MSHLRPFCTILCITVVIIRMMVLTRTNYILVSKRCPIHLFFFFYFHFRKERNERQMYFIFKMNTKSLPVVNLIFVRKHNKHTHYITQQTKHTVERRRNQKNKKFKSTAIQLHYKLWRTQPTKKRMKNENLTWLGISSLSQYPLSLSPSPIYSILYATQYTCDGSQVTVSVSHHVSSVWHIVSNVSF